METTGEQGFDDTRKIAKGASKGKLIDFSDSLEIKKVSVGLTEFDPDTKKPMGYTRYYLGRHLVL